MSYAWRQKVIPQDMRRQERPEAATCLLTGLPCQHATCPRFVDFNVWSRGRGDCEHREAKT